MQHTNWKKWGGRNRWNKILTIFLVVFLVGCSSRINNVSKVEIYMIDLDATPNASVLESSSVDKSLIRIVTNLVNNAKKMDIKLDESIFNKYFIIEQDGVERKIYFVIYIDSFDGYYHFENEEIYYQFKSNDLNELFDSGFDY
ncbi:MAG TPA: hypothetical protein DCQ90_00340 [Erysipelotrichaceae bacterium]|nr:MAG: hypothetical protein A2Y19_09925 [Firmicutes bacterium GWE2_51_13]HAO60423.1 hypothetical protein [Erysipelotrichaceae bacterium]